VQAFLKDLGNVFENITGSAAQGNQSSFLFFSTAGTNQTWLVPQDIVITSITNVAGTSSIALTTDGTNYTTNFAAAGNKKAGAIVYLGGSGNQIPQPTRFPIARGSTLTFANNSGSNAALLFYFES